MPPNLHPSRPNIQIWPVSLDFIGVLRVFLLTIGIPSETIYSQKVKFSALNVNTLRSLPIHLTNEANPTAQSNFNSMIPSHNLPKLITSNEAAEFLRVTPATVRNMIKDGRIQAIPVGRVGGRAVYRIPLQSLESLLGIDSRDQVTPETRNL